MGISHNRKEPRGWVWILLITAGTFFMGLGIVGIFVPILPTTPFLLLAAACYARSSQRFYDWLLNNRWFGSYLKNYLQGKGVPLMVKVITIGLLWVTIGCSIVFAVELLAVKVVLLLVAVGVSIHILSRRTFRP
ncbi:YbaN family protein [Chloroflexota bacterium]